MKKQLIPLVLPMVLCFLANSTEAQTKARLIGQTQRTKTPTGTYKVIDSTAYWYSSDRGSDLGEMVEDYVFEWVLTWNIKYDSGIHYGINSSGLFPKNKYVQLFDAANNVTDSTTYNGIPGGGWNNYARKTETYNSFNKAVFGAYERYVSMAWDSTMKFDYTYTATNKILTETVQVHSSGAWTPGYRYTYGYNTADNVSVMLYQLWNATAGVWVNYQMHTSTYDASGNLIEDVIEQWNTTTGIWDRSIKMLYTYDALHHKLSTQAIFWDPGASLWAAGGNLTTFSDFTGDHPGKVVMQTWISSTATYKNYGMQLISYNSYGLPTTYQLAIPYIDSTISWGEPGYINQYYYELYTAHTPQLTENNNARIYPVPASDKLSIDVDWAAPQAVIASISDIQGKVYSRWEVKPCSHYSENIVLNNLPAGNYVIRLEGSKERVVKNLVIIGK